MKKTRRSPYPSDITREQFELIRPLLESARKKTKPRQLDLYDMFCAVLYILTEGCRWRSLPHDYPKWQIVYHHFRVWSEMPEAGRSVLDKAREELVKSERILNGREPDTSMIILDSRSVKTTFVAEEKGFDCGKKNIRHKAPRGR